MVTPWNPKTVAQTERDRARGRKRAQRAFPAKVCESCGTTEGRLTRDHRDGNPLNNDPANISILCLICHGKTEWERGSYRNRPKPIIVRDQLGRIVRTLPSS